MQNSDNPIAADRTTIGAPIDPGRRAVQGASTSALTDQERLWLNQFLGDAFSVPDLRRLALLGLGTRLELMATVDGAAVPDIVLQLVDYCERHGTVDQLVDASRAQRPDRPDLTEFSLKRQQRLLASGGATGLADKASEALADLAKQAERNPSVAAVIAPALQLVAGQLSAASQAILRLGRYKALHDSLHQVQLKLGEILQAAARLHSSNAEAAQQASGELGTYALDLRRLVVTASQQAAGLPDGDRDRERDWIEELEEAAKALRGADVAERTQAAEQIRDLQNQQAPQINLQLVQIAGGMPLDAIVGALDTLAVAFQEAGHTETARIAAGGREAMRLLVPQLNALVSQHKQWQLLERDLALAESNTEQWRPEDRVPRWRRFRERLEVLCAQYEEQQWSIDLTRGLAVWQEQADNDNQQGSIVAFVDLRKDCRTRFFDVDSELNQLCGRLTGITAPLQKLQELARP